MAEPRALGEVLGAAMPAGWRERARTTTATTDRRTPGPSPDEVGDGEVCPLCRGAGFVRRGGIPPTDPAFGQIVPCRCRIEASAERRWERARRQSGLYPDLYDQTFDTFDEARQPAGYAAALDFAGAPERHWLVLYGETGTGKSHLLAAIANHLLLADANPLYYVAPDLLAWVREGFGAAEGEPSAADRLNVVKEAAVLLLDDLGTEQETEWQRETVFALINHRLAWRLPTAITTNQRPEDFPPRIASRLQDQARVRVVRMRAGDYRLSRQRAAERPKGGPR